MPYEWMEAKYRNLNWGSDKRKHVSQLSIEDIRKISKSPKVFEDYQRYPKLGNGLKIIDKARVLLEDEDLEEEESVTDEEDEDFDAMDRYYGNYPGRTSRYGRVKRWGR